MIMPGTADEAPGASGHVVSGRTKATAYPSCAVGRPRGAAGAKVAPAVVAAGGWGYADHEWDVIRGVRWAGCGAEFRRWPSDCVAAGAL